jgi:hypothetical protein
MMFQGTYNTRFYRALREALHCEVDYLNGRLTNGAAAQRLCLWNEVEALEKTCANAEPTALWTCC